MTEAAHPVRRLWKAAMHRIRLAAECAARLARLGCAVLRVPVRKPFLVLRCASGEAVSGLFSEFAAVLGALEHYERWRPIYAGIHVDFGSEGLYYDPARGSNWWDYYFETIDVGRREGAGVTVVSDRLHDIFAYRIPHLARDRGYALISLYIRLRPALQQAVDDYVRDRFGADFVIGVHYRGTDKWQDAPRVSYEEVEASVRAVARSAPDGKYRVFVATDEAAFIDFMRSRFHERLLYLEMFRSVDGRPMDVVNDDGNYRKGRDAVLDCVLLSRCHHLVRTASNLSLCSLHFNPGLPEVALNRERQGWP